MISGESLYSITIIIPTFNPDSGFVRLLDGLKNQTVQPNEIIIIDSESDNHVLDDIDLSGVSFEIVGRKNFDHGRTRDYCLRKSNGNIVVFMTQDAIPYDEHMLENLVEPFSNESIAAVMARQIAYPSASRQERYVREFSYPDVSRLTTPENMTTYGVDAYKLSDVCAAYRKSAYLDVGGFDYPILTNEDMLMAQKLLNSGYSIYYSADAKVFHSHDLSFRQQFARNHKIGFTLEAFSERFCNVEETGRGANLAFSVGFRLLKGFHIIAFFRFFVDCVARFAGNRKGHIDCRKHD